MEGERVRRVEELEQERKRLLEDEVEIIGESERQKYDPIADAFKRIERKPNKQSLSSRDIILFVQMYRKQGLLTLFVFVLLYKNWHSISIQLSIF